MVIKVNELKVGDEILVPAQGRLKYLRVLRDPKLKRKSNDVYRAVLCSCKLEELKHTYGTKTYTYKVPVCTPDDHNTEKYENLNYKMLWLIKRKGE